MASNSLVKWQTVREVELDELLAAHHRVGGKRPGRRYATQQLNFAYLVAVAAQFQGFCRDLHSEATSVFSNAAGNKLSAIVMATLTKNRKLDQGNANAGTIAEDFGRIGMHDFWDQVAKRGGVVTTNARKNRLEQMNMWRNAIAHNDFEQYQAKVDKLDGVLRPRLVQAATCRRAAGFLATQMSESVSIYLAPIVGAAPW